MSYELGTQPYLNLSQHRTWNKLKIKYVSDPDCIFNFTSSSGSAILIEKFA